MDDTKKELPLDDLIKRGWPLGLPTMDRVALDRLSSEEVEGVRRRLAAVLRWIEPSMDEKPYDGAAEAAVSAGLAKSQFYQLVLDWKRQHSVASLAVGGRSRQRASKIGDVVKAEISATITRALAEDPQATTGSLLREISALHPQAPSRTTLLRLIEAARRTAPPGRFGGRIVFDSAGLDLVDPEGYRLRLYAAIDDGTGMILGWAAATQRWGVSGYVDAADLALDLLFDLDIDGIPVAEEETVVEVRVDASLPDDANIFGNTAVKVTHTVGIDRCGKLLVRALGDRIGPVWLGVGSRADGVSFRTGRKERMPEMTASMLQMIEETINSRNSDIVGRARQGGDGAIGSEKMQEVIRRMRAIADLRSLIEDDR